MRSKERIVYGNAFRVARMRHFMELADAVLAHAPICRVLDIGGEEAYWLNLEEVWRERALKITIINLGNSEITDPRFEYLIGDARDLSEHADNSFDIVHSNSVLEHVGRWADMRRMACEVRRLAPAYFVQTPNFWFPFEPHMRLPFIHWLPHPLQAAIVARRSCGFYPRATSMEEAQHILSDAYLLDKNMLRALFPDAKLLRERFGPWTKSLIAIRTPMSDLAQAQIAEGGAIPLEDSDVVATPELRSSPHPAISGRQNYLSQRG